MFCHAGAMSASAVPEASRSDRPLGAAELLFKPAVLNFTQ